MNYQKYYFLENYLFSEVRKNFRKNHHLKSDEFFCVVIWKANRAKTKIKKKLLSFENNLDKAIKVLTEKIYFAKTPEEKLKILLSDYKFQLPMATAILTVLYPNKFTIYDVRVRTQLKIKDIYGSPKYFSEFLPKIKSVPFGKSLREKDQYLWGKSFYKDLLKLIMVAKKV